ncbi:hypothetical protein KI387_006272, partial [Taxus chinensis]
QPHRQIRVLNQVATSETVNTRRFGLLADPVINWRQITNAKSRLVFRPYFPSFLCTFCDARRISPLRMRIILEIEPVYS